MLYYGCQSKRSMDETQIWKERYQALSKMVEEKYSNSNDLSNLHIERIRYLESEIKKYQNEISLLKEQIQTLDGGREYDC